MVALVTRALFRKKHIKDQILPVIMLHQANDDDRLRRFDLVFRTLLVVATISLSAGLSFFKDIISPYAFFYAVVPFILAICVWSFSVLHDGPSESIFKIMAWWTLMCSFILLISRLALSFSFFLPPMVTTASVVGALVLTRPFVTYFRGLDDDGLRWTMKILRLIVVGIFVADLISLVVFLIRFYI